MRASSCVNKPGYLQNAEGGRYPSGYFMVQCLSIDVYLACVAVLFAICKYLNRQHTSDYRLLANSLHFLPHNPSNGNSVIFTITNCCGSDQIQIYYTNIAGGYVLGDTTCIYNTLNVGLGCDCIQCISLHNNERGYHGFHEHTHRISVVSITQT